MFGKKKAQQAANEMVNQAAQAAQAANAAAFAQSPQDVMAQQRALGIDTANFGGPSNAPLADDDPMWEPIEGITLQHYGWISKLAANQGVTDEAGVAALAEANGIDGQQYLRGAAGWTQRMQQNMNIGSKFREYYNSY